MALNQKRLMYTGAIFVALMLVTYGLNLTALSILLPISGNEYGKGDTISFKTELAGHIEIPAAFGAGCSGDGVGDLSKGPCYTFDKSTFLQDDVVIDVVNVYLEPTRPASNPYTWALIKLRCGNSPKVPPPTTAWEAGTNLLLNTNAQGEQVSAVNANFDYMYMDGQCVLISGVKSGINPQGRYDTPFSIMSNQIYTGAGISGWNVFVAKVPASSNDKTKFTVQLRLINQGQNVESNGWILDACVQANGVACENDIIEIPPIAETCGNGVCENAETAINCAADCTVHIDDPPIVPPITGAPFSLTQNPWILLAFAVISYLGAGYFAKN